jgi:hypothetical protein
MVFWSFSSGGNCVGSGGAHILRCLPLSLVAFIGPMSSQTRQRFPLYQVRCRAQVDMLLYNCYNLIYSSALYHLKPAFELRKSQIFCKICGFPQRNFPANSLLLHIPKESC